MSSRLLDSATITQVVPWRFDEKEEDNETRRLSFEAADRFADSGSDHHRESRGPSADHSKCERQAEGLEREIHRLTAQMAEDKRAAYRQGFEAGVTQEMAKWDEALVRSAKSIADLAVWKPRLRSQVEEDAVRLSLAIAKKVLRREVNVDPGTIAGLLRVALEKLNSREVLRIRTAPGDAGDLSARLVDFGLPVQVEVVADGGLERGSLLLDTTRGHVDASIDTQLSEISEGLPMRWIENATEGMTCWNRTFRLCSRSTRW